MLWGGGGGEGSTEIRTQYLFFVDDLATAPPRPVVWFRSLGLTFRTYTATNEILIENNQRTDFKPPLRPLWPILNLPINPTNSDGMYGAN